MKTILLFSCIVLAPFSALAQSFPVQRVEQSCPLGYYIQGSYCSPSRSNPDRWAMPSPNKTACPLGSYRNGQYCSKAYGSY